MRGLQKSKRVTWPPDDNLCQVVLDDVWRVVAAEESEEMEVQNRREMRVLEAIYPRPSAIPPNPCTEQHIQDNFHNDQNIPVVPIVPIEEEDAADISASIAPNTLPQSQPQILEPGASQSQCSPTVSPPPGGVHVPGIVPGIESDVLAAAVNALITNNNQGNLIDPELLMRILSDPNMIQQLVANHGAGMSSQNLPATSTPTRPTISTPNTATTSTQVMPRSRSPAISFSSTSQLQVHKTDPPHAYMSGVQPIAVPSMTPPPIPTTQSTTNYPNPGGLGALHNLQSPVSGSSSAPSPSAAAPVRKDINYYKSLIQQHGEERPDFGSSSSHSHLGSTQELLGNRSRDSRARIMKPCIYFNSSRGCRHGTNCAYQHDASSSQQRVTNVPEVQGAKRMKLDREITGT